MNSLLRRVLLFVFFCIPSRVLLAYGAKYASRAVKVLLAKIALVISFGFMYIFVTGIRKTGMETMGAPIWWNALRPVHSILYASYALMTFAKKQNAYLPLVVDVVIGFLGFLMKHFS